MIASGATLPGDSSAENQDQDAMPESGDGIRRDDVFLALYGQLRALARLHLTAEGRQHTLQATALVHEAWLRVAAAGASAACGPDQLLAAAAQAMRRVLIDFARARVALKRGGRNTRPLSLDAVDLANSGSFVEILAVDEALRRLQEVHPKAAEVVRLRFYVGLDMDEIATALGVSERTVFREWSYARAWLFKRLHGDAG